jgi:hypothetical protein
MKLRGTGELNSDYAIPKTVTLIFKVTGKVTQFEVPTVCRFESGHRHP